MNAGIGIPRTMAPVVLLAAVTLTGCSAPSSPTKDISGADQATTLEAEQVMQVTSVHQATGMTLLEGPTFAPAGELYVVDVTAPPEAGKVLRVDIGAEKVSTVYTDNHSALTSAQFNPRNGRLYVTDFAGGAVRSMNADGGDVQEVFTGPVNGTPMQPDDISFDSAGNMFITDAAGARAPHWKPTGRVVRLDGATSQPVVLGSNLESPNGIAFSPDESALWVGLNTGNRIDHLTLSKDGTSVATAHPAIYASVGEAQVDSIAVDADGNLYVGLHNRPEVLVYNVAGKLRSTVSIPAAEKAGLSSATNVAIRPGTTEAYVTVSGPNGGYLYSFDALANGIRQSNGG